MSRTLRVTVCFVVRIPEDIGDQSAEDIYIRVNSATVGCNDAPVTGAEILDYCTCAVEEVGLQ